MPLRNPSARPAVAALAFGLLLGPAVASSFAAPATQPAAQDSPEADTANVEMSKNFGVYSTAIKSVDFADPDARAKAAPSLVPQLRQMTTQIDKLAELSPNMRKTCVFLRRYCRVEAAALGDADTLAALQKQKTGNDPDQALMAESDLLQVQWRQAGTDADKQTAVAAAVETLAKSHPDSTDVTETLMVLAGKAATPALHTRLNDAALAMNTPLAKRRLAMAKGDGKLDAHVGAPLMVMGKTPDGRPFSTAPWRGKVVLIDFWATWCGPCKAELPRVKEAYAKYHAAGLEVLGVSNDYSAEALTTYCKQHDLPWPQLFDANAAKEEAWHPLTNGLGINGIPVMILVDKKGVCRSVTARADFEKLIPKLLEEAE